MFEEHYKDGSFAGEKSRNFRLIGVRFGLVVAIVIISLIAVGYMKWSKASLHDQLMKRHQTATAYYEKNFFRNSDGVYAIHYTFSVNGKRYRNYNYFKTIPSSPEGVVYYNPDDPEENELQPFE